MDYVALFVGAVIAVTGLVMGYFFSPGRVKKNVIPVHVKSNGNLQKFSQNEFLEVTLAKISKITHDTYIFTYDLPDPELPLGLHPGQHIVVHAEIPTKEGGLVKRKYTPISRVDQKGTFELLVKIYRRNAHPSFPEGGVLTQYLESLKVGDKLKISGPVGKLWYYGNGYTRVQRKHHVQSLKVRRFGFICGGTGISPMYQMIKAILDNPRDRTEVTLLFGNKTEADILLRQELEGLATDPRFEVHYTLDTAPQGWKGFTGYVTPELIKKTMPTPGEDTLICICGPYEMNKMLKRQLEELGCLEEQFFKFCLNMKVA